VGLHCYSSVKLISEYVLLLFPRGGGLLEDLKRFTDVSTAMCMTAQLFSHFVSIFESHHHENMYNIPCAIKDNKKYRIIVWLNESKRQFTKIQNPNSPL